MMYYNTEVDQIHEFLNSVISFVNTHKVGATRSDKKKFLAVRQSKYKAFEKAYLSRYVLESGISFKADDQKLQALRGNIVLEEQTRKLFNFDPDFIYYHQDKFVVAFSWSKSENSFYIHQLVVQ